MIQLGRLEEETDAYHEVTPSDKSSGFANGLSHRCVYQVAQELSYGLFAGGAITLHSMAHPGNSIAPVMSIADVSALGAVLDLATSSISIRGRAPMSRSHAPTLG